MFTFVLLKVIALAELVVFAVMLATSCSNLYWQQDCQHYIASVLGKHARQKGILLNSEMTVNLLLSCTSLAQPVLAHLVIDTPRGLQSLLQDASCLSSKAPTNIEEHAAAAACAIVFCCCDF